MTECRGYAAIEAKKELEPFNFQRRELRENDVFVEIDFCGVCHSDIHTARGEWAGNVFPVVPGHEIIGHVKQVGSKVSKYKEGDHVGVGVLVDSCQTCPSCKENLEQYCENEKVLTYGAKDLIDGQITYGGYSSSIIVREEFVLKIPDNLDPAAAAPLLCAGITTYSPLKHWGVGPDSHVGVAGLGGLGHMAVKLAKALGAKVTVFTTSPSKKEDAHRLGADRVILSKNEDEMRKGANSMDFILNTIAAAIDLQPYIECLKREGVMTLVGIPEHPHSGFSPAPLISKRRSVAGSVIGGLKETQEMLDFCGEHNIVSDIEKIPVREVNEAFERTVKGDVKYRFVLDLKTL